MRKHVCACWSESENEITSDAIQWIFVEIFKSFRIKHEKVIIFSTILWNVTSKSSDRALVKYLKMMFSRREQIYQQMNIVKTLSSRPIEVLKKWQFDLSKQLF